MDLRNKITLMALSDITPYENNPRNNEEAVEKVANSIKEFGFNQPIVVDKDNVIIVGHTRYLAAQELGLAEAPVIVAGNLSDEQARAYRQGNSRHSYKNFRDRGRYCSYSGRTLLYDC
jgi:site-specific DNA-methyltransferase (adenine-specific)